MTRKFPLGKVVATVSALARVPARELTIALRRHRSGDWGDVSSELRETNNIAMVHGMRLLSLYHAENGTQFCIITEWDRSFTFILLPADC